MTATYNSSQFLLTAGPLFAGPFRSRSSRPTAIQAFAGAAAAAPQRRVGGMKQTNLYEVLRVKQNASPVEIKTAYRHLAKLFHPDVASSESADGPHFIEIHHAYVTLSDPMARARYDVSIGVRDRLLRYAEVGSRRCWRRWETDQCW